MATLQADAAGTRGHLTSSQTRALYRLWQRFFRLCEVPAGGLSASASSTSNHAQQQQQQQKNGAGLGPVHSSASSSGEKLPGTTPSSSAATASGSVAGGRAPDSASRLSTSASSASIGKAGTRLQRMPSGRTIDERGSHIPKDDRVKDELKTIEEAKEMRMFLEKYGGAKLREVFWDMVKGEHPDALMLRFLRARKWNVDRAIAVIGSTAAFRADNDVEGILREGEKPLVKTRGGRNILENGIAYVYGSTPVGEPIWFIEVGRHFSHNQTQEELKRGVILMQEWMQLLMIPPTEKKVVIFNLNEFGIRNMDWWCVFFMVKTMESYYVETLARVYVHGAPWIFKPIWAILRPLLDPVVRDKIRLTSHPEELAEYIPLHHLPKGTMQGQMDWAYQYEPPVAHEDDAQFETEKRDQLKAEFRTVADQFERATKEIANLYVAQILQGGSRQDYEVDGDEIDAEAMERDEEEGRRRRTAADPSARRGSAFTTSTSTTFDDENIGAELKAKRDVLATRLRVAWLKLRPYVIGTTIYNRWGAARDDGLVHWRYRAIGQDDGDEEVQELGKGTSLSALEENLRLIGEASPHLAGPAEGNKGVFGDTKSGDGSTRAVDGGAPMVLTRSEEERLAAQQRLTASARRREARRGQGSRPTTADAFSGPSAVAVQDGEVRQQQQGQENEAVESAQEIRPDGKPHATVSAERSDDTVTSTANAAVPSASTSTSTPPTSESTGSQSPVVPQRDGTSPASPAKPVPVHPLEHLHKD